MEKDKVHYPRILGLIPGLTPPKGGTKPPQGFTRLPTTRELINSCKDWLVNRNHLWSDPMTTLLIEPKKQKHPSHRILLHEPSGTLFAVINFDQQLKNCVVVDRENLEVSGYAHVVLDHSNTYSWFYVQDLRELPLVFRMLSDENLGDAQIVVSPEYFEKVVSGPY